MNPQGNSNGFQTLKQNSMNDSLDNMRREFFTQFNNLLGESVGFAGSGTKFQQQLMMSPLNRLSE